MTTKLSIRKALTLKNRLVKEMKELQGRVQAHNVIQTMPGCNSEVPYKVDELMITLEDTMRNLVELKAAIQASNVSIYPFLCEMEEQKSHIAFRRTIPIDDRTTAVHPQGYGKELIIVAIKTVIKTIENDTAIASAEKRIEELQDLVDQHNATTQVEVSF